MFCFCKKNKLLHKESLFTITPCHIAVANGGHPRVCMSAAGPPPRWAHTPQPLTKIHTRGVISVPLSRYRHAPPPIATPQQCRLSSPSARPSSPFSRPSIPLPVRPSIHPPARVPAVPSRGGACAGGARRGAPHGAALLPRGRGTRGSARTAGRAPWTAWGGRWQAPRVCPCAGAGGGVRVTAGLPQGQSAWALARRGGCAPHRDARIKPRCGCLA